ncbi:MAG: APC family permease [Acetobacteraceae bacterium]
MTDRNLATGPALRRVLTLWPLIFYGLGVIVGAGIYVAIGAVVARAGEAAPLSFLLAGIAAGLTGLCYAELGSRFPEAAGGVSYVRRGFGSDRLAQVTGAAMTLAVAVAAASIARGTAQYLGVLLPLPEPWLVAGVILGFTVIALTGVRASVGLAATMGAIEILGLLAATAVGLISAPDLDATGLIPASAQGWGMALSGAFIAFFAFIGFETLANLAEEVKEPQRTLPRGVLGAVAASVVLYVGVALAVVLSGKAGANPLLALFPASAGTAFAVVGTIAVANGVLVEIVMLARLFYGMARNGQLPARLAVVHPRSQTPTNATLLAGGIVLVTALTVPFERLLVAANGITLAIFTLVAAALWRVKARGEPVPGTVFTVPAWVPPCAALVCLSLILAEFIG